ncbi:MAG TPA: FlgD immunoglobulin-like domain containing protein [Candidatus Limnocylindria bacterium]|nr:FlgD immunoglobulin-like domain containing protein [Candidatus Limnocylindria bacterium]
MPRPFVATLIALSLVAATQPALAQTPALRGFWPTRGEPGTEVKITGENLGGTNAVQFGGIDARFRVVTGTLVRAWVPEGAKTGPIRLLSADADLSSPTRFVVLGGPNRGVEFARPYPSPSPGPFRLSFTLSVPTRARLAIHDLRGARVRVLVDEQLPEGPHEVHWDGLDERAGRLPTGAYFARLEAQGSSQVHRLVVRY